MLVIPVSLHQMTPSQCRNETFRVFCLSSLKLIFAQQKAERSLFVQHSSKRKKPKEFKKDTEATKLARNNVQQHVTVCTFRH